MNSEKAAKANKAVQKKVMETDDKVHKQIQKIKESSIGKMIPTEYEKIGIDKVALASIVVSAVIYMYTYLLLASLYPKDVKEAFIGLKFGIFLGFMYTVSIIVDLFIYWFRKSSFLLIFLLVRIISFISTVISLFFLKGVAFNAFFSIFIIVSNLITGALHCYLFGLYISHMKAGGTSGNGDQQQV